MENWKRKPSGRAIDRLTLHRSGEVVWLSFPILDRFDFLLNGFSTRLGGVSEGDTGTMNLSFSREPDRGKVRENHERLAEAMGYRPENLVFSAQTHTDHIVEAGASDRGNGYLRENCFQDVDGMMTDEPELVLMTFFADCVPLLIADPRRRAIAAVHSGWRGTAGRMGEVTILRMISEFGCDPKDIICAVGPSICEKCYEIGEDVAEQFRFGESTLPAIKMRKERIHHFYFARDKGDLFIISTVPPAGPGGGVAVDTVNGHGAVQEADLPVEREPESNGIIRKAVGKGNALKIRRIAHPLRPADNGTGVETEAHTADNGGKRDVPVPRFGEKKGVRPIPCTETIQGIVDTGRIVRMGIEKINLLLKLGRICPEVIPLTIGNILPAGVGIHDRFVDVDAL